MDVLPVDIAGGTGSAVSFDEGKLKALPSLLDILDDEFTTLRSNIKGIDLDGLEGLNQDLLDRSSDLLTKMLDDNTTIKEQVNDTISECGLSVDFDGDISESTEELLTELNNIIDKIKSGDIDDIDWNEAFTELCGQLKTKIANGELTFTDCLFENEDDYKDFLISLSKIESNLSKGNSDGLNRSASAAACFLYYITSLENGVIVDYDHAGTNGQHPWTETSAVVTGVDCNAWAGWLVDKGVSDEDGGFQWRPVNSFASIGEAAEYKDVQTGDILLTLQGSSSGGHVMYVVANDPESETVIVAQASGENVGITLTEISYDSLSSKGVLARDLTKVYSGEEDTNRNDAFYHENGTTPDVSNRDDAWIKNGEDFPEENASEILDINYDGYKYKDGKEGIIVGTNSGGSGSNPTTGTDGSSDSDVIPVSDTTSDDTLVTTLDNTSNTDTSEYVDTTDYTSDATSGTGTSSISSAGTSSGSSSISSGTSIDDIADTLPGDDEVDIPLPNANYNEDSVNGYVNPYASSSSDASSSKSSSGSTVGKIIGSVVGLGAVGGAAYYGSKYLKKKQDILENGEEDSEEEDDDEDF